MSANGVTHIRADGYSGVNELLEGSEGVRDDEGMMEGGGEREGAGKTRDKREKFSLTSSPLFPPQISRLWFNGCERRTCSMSFLNLTCLKTTVIGNLTANGFLTFERGD